jgi:signal transduction histidine kinase
LINDILDLQKLEADAMVFDLQPLDLSEIVEQTIAANAGYADMFGVTIVLERMAPGCCVVADSDRLTQVLTNLLSNACKFSPPGGQVQVTIEAGDETVRVAVSDRGPGIPEAFRDRVFEKFAQANVAANRKQGGTGLGLSISKAIVDKLGGEIGFETASDVGTTFFVDLPLFAIGNPAINGVFETASSTQHFGRWTT